MAAHALSEARSWVDAFWQGFAGSLQLAYFLACLALLSAACIWFVLQLCASVVLDRLENVFVEAWAPKEKRPPEGSR